ncbi:MAG: acetate/propionate family kinase [Rhodothermales bacterium]|nr:acetate/propionate family kinase [Rhodothermales bacterium]
MSILVMNAGSSSLKLGLFDADTCDPLAAGLLEWATDGRGSELVWRMADGKPGERVQLPADRPAAIREALASIDRLDGSHARIRAVGHRVVHRGPDFSSSVRIDDRVMERLIGLYDLAPLHNPAAVAVIEATGAALPDIDQVAVFDTAFFARLPESARVYPLPYAWYSAWGIRRYGFHGISHAYCAERAAQLLGRDPGTLRLVTCHLGQGCSASAIRGGEPVATTMGFTPLEGLMMGTRSGSVDPGILLYVQRTHGISVEALERALQKESGLFGVSGVSGDYREVEAAATAGHARARLALTLFADRVRAAVGALAVQLGGVDALVFTAGVGENARGLRSEVCRGLECLGLVLDADLNASADPDADLAEPGSPARILAIHTREDWMIARETQRVVGISHHRSGGLR